MNRSKFASRAMLVAILALSSMALPAFADSGPGIEQGNHESNPAKFAEHKQKALEHIDANRQCIAAASNREDLQKCRPNKERREQWRENHQAGASGAGSQGQRPEGPPGAGEKPPR